MAGSKVKLVAAALVGMSLLFGAFSASAQSYEGYSEHVVLLEDLQAGTASPGAVYEFLINSESSESLKAPVIHAATRAGGEHLLDAASALSYLLQRDGGTKEVTSHIYHFVRNLPTAPEGWHASDIVWKLLVDAFKNDSVYALGFNEYTKVTNQLHTNESTRDISTVLADWVLRNAPNVPTSARLLAVSGLTREQADIYIDSIKNVQMTDSDSMSAKLGLSLCLVASRGSDEEIRELLLLVKQELAEADDSIRPIEIRIKSAERVDLVLKYLNSQGFNNSRTIEQFQHSIKTQVGRADRVYFLVRWMLQSGRYAEVARSIEQLDPSSRPLIEAVLEAHAVSTP